MKVGKNMKKLYQIASIFIIIILFLNQIEYSFAAETKDSKIITDGIYEIETAVNEEKVVEVRDASQYSGGNVQIFAKNNAKCQKVKIKSVGNGYYTLQFTHSNMFLDVADGKTANGTNVWQCRQNGSDAQKWKIEVTDDGYYKLISKCSNTYLTVAGGKTANCTNIEINAKKNDKSQKFKFNKIETIKGKQTIKDGFYEIETGINPEKVVEVKNASQYSGGNVQISSKNNKKNQIVNVKYQNDGYYTLKFIHSGMYLDVANAETTNSTNVWQCRENGADAQKWVITETEDGYYNIISKCSNTYLTVAGGKTADGTNIEINKPKDDKSQKFKFVKTDIYIPTKTIQDGTYEIETGVSTEKAVEVRDASQYSGGNVQIFAKNNAKCQKVNVKYVGDGYYTLEFTHSGMYLDVADGKKANGTNVWQCRYNGSDAQKWAIKETEEGYYNLISKCSNTYLTVAGGKTANCTNIEINSAKNDNSQKFKFNKIESVKGSKTIEDGIYYIQTGIDSEKVVEVKNSSQYSGGNVQTATKNDKKSQKVNVKYLGNGYYTIQFRHSSMYLDVANAETTNGTNVWQCRENGADAQKWVIQKTEDGYYKLISKCSNSYLTVNGTNIEINSTINNNSQKFKFIQTKDDILFETGTYGESGLKIKGDSRGSSLKYYKIGNGSNVFFATFAVHGFEDLWNNDGQELTKVAETFKNRLLSKQDIELANDWTIYIFPSVNPDGEYHGYTNNGPGRTTLYSAAPSNKGVDINRCWSTGYTKYTDNRNYNGTEPFQAYEARALRDFLLKNRATNGQTILVDLHGWLNETIGDNGIGTYYRQEFGMSKHISTYGNGYLVNWSRNNLGYNGKIARACLVEMPEQSDPIQIWEYAENYIDATIKMLKSII